MAQAGAVEPIVKQVFGEEAATQVVVPPDV